ncbi:hypothetical protein RIF29_00825 [Crotalaria pallida]|uniref:Uncharacterized protein n=1 Tax=Crotalaria pallida TaxID=3830 RepID=A0AAN9IY23_CROPI
MKNVIPYPWYVLFNEYACHLEQLIFANDVSVILLMLAAKQEYPEYRAYITPVFFCDYWLNLYLDNFRMHSDSNTYQQNKDISIHSALLCCRKLFVSTTAI